MDLGAVNELFNPSAKHTEDERQRLEHTRVAEGDHEPGCGPVDLDSGTVLMVPSDAGMILPPKVRVEEQAEDDEDEPEV
ncbi:hypothetical protein E4198_05915 [Streptomyces sp. RKND-216]|uniref:DUF6191 domain-containing protein n=1 Tax=Streptomyces sp. RKND-216 TaxID=2562581 RepID=UPI00109DB745|nr:DUF6191 domain-containing protein [Streptomyces sp. RKND-216]THA24343.1 hypothetical protein E4198_05915 [Streptomyces sp. RKND-216]